MTPRSATRRLWLFGLLLVLPALAVGGLALGLLAREQARLTEREGAAREARQAAVEARARLIAENIELLLGDVQAALMNTLLEAPAAEPRRFLTDWQASNPLVRDVFRATAEGLPVWGAASDPLREWLAQGPPWYLPADLPVAERAVPAPALASATTRKAAAAPAAPAVSSSLELDSARSDISQNVLQYQRARQEIQEVARVRGPGEARSLGAVAPAAAAPPEAAAPAGTASLAEVPVADFLPAPLMASALPVPAPAGGTEPGLGAEGQPLADKAQAAAGGPMASPEPITRSGWTPWRGAEGLHLFGWRELPDGTVVGLELRLDAIKARLGEVFPASPETGEAYGLQDGEGRPWHRVGPKTELPRVFEVPLAGAMLPGWSIRAEAAGLEAGSGPAGARGFFGLGASLVGLLVLMILAAGALLLRELRRSEAEAALKTSFVANVSHELKTPLTTIRLYAELLAQGRVRDEAKRADYLATIGQETQRLARLVGNVLDFSRLEQGKKQFAPAEFDLVAELRRFGEVHGPRVAEAGLALRLEGPEALVCTSDREALEQILLNLVDNACKYAAGGGEVALAVARESDGAVRLVVGDRGPGVPEEQRERIFEKFHRVDDRLTAEKGGAGLGLSIARQLARGLGGELGCESRPGGGAAFVLSLPPGGAAGSVPSPKIS